MVEKTEINKLYGKLVSINPTINNNIEYVFKNMTYENPTDTATKYMKNFWTGKGAVIHILSYALVFLLSGMISWILFGGILITAIVFEVGITLYTLGKFGEYELYITSKTKENLKLNKIYLIDNKETFKLVS